MPDFRDYSTRTICLEALEIVRRHFPRLEMRIPPARWVSWGNDYNWRFTERRIEQLLLQKLARQITGVQTIDLLLSAGYLQEVGVLYRTLDEIEQDIFFLVLGIRTGTWTPHHDKYVEYFWSEDDDSREPPVRRKTIRAYVNRATGQSDPATGDAVQRLIHKTYSDYTHARSAPIMGMMKGPPPRFDLNGIHNDQARFPYVQQNPTYFYRCLVSTCVIANLVYSEEERMLIYGEVKSFERRYESLLFGADGNPA